MKLIFIKKKQDIVMAKMQITLSVCMAVIVLLSSCSNTKYLPKGETLYTGSTIKYISSDSSAKAEKEVLKEELQAIILPKPNRQNTWITGKIVVLQYCRETYR